MEPRPTEKWLLKIDGCGLSALPRGDACEHLPGKGGFGQGEAGEQGHIPLLEMLRLRQANFIQARLWLSLSRLQLCSPIRH